MSAGPGARLNETPKSLRDHLVAEAKGQHGPGAKSGRRGGG